MKIMKFMKIMKIIKFIKIIKQQFLLIKKYSPGWVDGWMDGGWMDVKVVLRIANSNQKVL